jgi:hypothetical protein
VHPTVPVAVTVPPVNGELKVMLVTVPDDAAPPSLRVTPSVEENSARWFAVDEPGPIAQVEQPTVPVVVIVPPDSGELNVILVTVPLPLPPEPLTQVQGIETVQTR